MVTLLLCAQLAAALPNLTADSTYSSAALRSLVADASDANRRVPDSLASYASRIETETSLIVRDTLGREHTSEVEQLATSAHWQRDGRYDLHILGYRSQSVGVPYSTLTIVRGWTVPSLYGERLSLGAYFAQGRGRGRDTVRAVHPFARDRDDFYRFEGGDTIATLRAGGREIPIVRIRVHPHFTSVTRLAAFDGEIDIDGDRKQIVRMRGQFVVVGGERPIAGRILQGALGVTAAAYVEFVNAEIDGKYWLPAFQRTEFQAGFGLFGQGRPVFRIVSTIADIRVSSGSPPVDSLARPRVTVSWASSDSVDHFDAWRRSLGEQTAGVHSDDFDDLAPDRWRPTGAPRLDWFPSTTARVLRFNRVEGAFVGVAPTVDMRSRVPGLSFGAYGGWAFSERTARGGGFVNYRRGVDRFGIRAERALASTNDFGLPLADDPGLAALLASVDNDDYVDRATAMVSVTRTLGGVSAGLVTLQGGVGRDRGEVTRISHGLFKADGFRPNRGVDDGNYALGSADLELHPNVTGDFVAPGYGARMHYEVGRGDLDWQRAEMSLAARSYYGPVSVAAHADAGVVTGGTPAQRLFELGGTETLPGYDYKEFVGDRAALFRGYASYRFSVLKRPVRVRNFFLPAINPGIGASVQGGWTELSTASARAAALRLGVDENGAAIAGPTHGVRATAGGGLTLLSDVLHVGASRPIERAGKWRFAVGVGLAF